MPDRDALTEIEDTLTALCPDRINGRRCGSCLVCQLLDVARKSPFERKRRRWWLMVWPDDNARSVHNRDPKRKARDIMKVVEVVPAYELRGAVEALEQIRAVVGEMEASDTHTPYNLSRLGLIRAHVARGLGGQ